MGLGHSPSIIVDGLLFHIDPSNSRCYSGSGNTIYNLVNPSIGATFVGFTSNPVDNTEMRSIYFDGVNDYIDIINSSSWTFTTISICLWFKKNSGSVFKGVVDKGRDNYGAWSLCIDETANRVTFKVRIGGVNRSVTTASNYSFNGWTFIAGVYDGSTLSIYQNESLSSSAAYSGSIGTNAYSIRIGADNDGNCVNGLISSVSIYNKGLTAIEVLQNYNATRKKYYPDENIVTNGLILHIDPSKNTSYPGTGNTIYDLSGFGNTGTLSAGLTFSSLNGGSIVNDAGNKVLSYPSANFSTNNFTMEAWVSVKNYPGTNAVFISNRGTSDNGWLLDVTLNKKGRIFIQRDAGTSYSLETISDLGLNKWANLSVVRNGTNLSLYRDGIFQNSTTLPSNYDIQSAYANDYALRYFTSNGPLDGNISTIKYYNRALSVAEVQQNYNATKGRFLNALPPVSNGLVLELDAGQRSSYPGTGNTWYDLSGNSLNGALTNGPTFSGIGATSSIVFDGSNDYIDCGYNSIINSSTQFTIECWYKSSNISVEGMLFSTFINSPSNLGYHLEIWQSKLSFQVYPSGQLTQSTTTLSNNTWYQLIATYNSGAVQYFVNGQSAGTASYTFNPSSTNLLIGKWPTNSYYLNGQLAITKFYNRALSAYEVKQNFDYYRTRYNI